MSQGGRIVKVLMLRVATNPIINLDWFTSPALHAGESLPRT
jgi:hypothetical protein